MSGFLNYFYVFLWLALAVMVAVAGRKEGALAWALSGFFVFMTVWYGLRAFFGIAAFEGVLGIIFRVIVIACLGGMVAVILWRRKNRK